MANYTKIKPFDIANGIGIRTSIFFSGCDLHCPGCFNQDIWDFSYGQPFTREVYELEIGSTLTSHISGISILGGEPLHIKNQDSVYDLITWFRQDFPAKDIWLWTGYEDTAFTPAQVELTNLCDVIVTGPYIEPQRDLTLPFRGSRNQKIKIHKAYERWYLPSDEEVREGSVFKK